MGNCQAIDNATLVIQHPNGKSEKHYTPISAQQIMKLNPGHYVALLLTTTLYSSASASTSTASASRSNNAPLRITRIKLLRPTDTLSLGHVYRLVTTQEVMKGLWAKKQAKMKEQQIEKANSDFDAVVGRRSDDDMEKTKQVRQERKHRSRSNTGVNSAIVSKSRAWQPALNSISEAGT